MRVFKYGNRPDKEFPKDHIVEVNRAEAWHRGAYDAHVLHVVDAGEPGQLLLDDDILVSFDAGTTFDLAVTEEGQRLIVTPGRLGVCAVFDVTTGNIHVSLYPT